MDTEKDNAARSDLNEAALFFHKYPVAGKLEIQATKPLGNQRDLALAYSPGVAAPCLAIQEEPATAADYTARANLVGVISNGTAVLGLGDIGPLASKPVMEGKAVLFKKFAGIDVFDIEIDAPEVDQMVETISALEPTFGGINLEDIKAPECFEVEDRLKQRMNIPVFHDDQHGTAIIVAAAILNGLALADKNIEEVKIVTSGAGAAALACLNLLVSLGASVENIWVTDRYGVAHKGRTEEMDRWKDPYVKDTNARTLEDVIEGTDVFLGLSAAGVLKPELLKLMAEKPLILALANPVPEIMPEVARAARPDAMICTGRSDFPNQVNNVLCFPYIFRGALDCGASAINEEMKLAAVRAIAALAREEPSDVAAKAYSGETPTFGPDFLIPSPFDPRLILRIAPAVAKAACDSGVATRPIEDFPAYLDRLNRFVFRSGLVMKPVFSAAKASGAKRVIYADGEDERVLRAAQVVLEEGIAQPILIGRPSVVDVRLRRYGLRIRPGKDFELINPEDDPRYRDYVELLIELGGRRGITQEAARTMVRTDSTVIAGLAMRRDEADAMICGLEGRFARHLRNVSLIIGTREGVRDRDFSALSMLISSRGVTFYTDTYVTLDPSAEEIAEMTILAAEEIRRFGIEPKAALLSYSNFGSRDATSAIKMREAADILKRIAPDLQSDGEMHADSALSEHLRQRVYPHSTLKGEANLLVFPNLDAANITLNTVKQMTDALHVGPILLGTAQPAHILTPSVTSRGVVNMTALAVVEAGQRAQATLTKPA
ncbi:malate dehydrogenase (oxaloacetate-decarboxylating)(NADP+) [Pseudaminobacter salicylatoxidans]|uniref:Malate dehydrogenase (Oxaloacetate-decarboxylating)(NADP+) n=1 Tax=Pseudaminobacter salicylatoxidans TaxID=93369 RepID=A0A316CA64_PSESE|nr:NADP-dependent malic enzyme [Pseudaminobacter salicylatoxidans]PWJ85966.1 malate dehydrogenase (oxaloacetate-decarboxylating)(NADP+) [Pseudaminobacter salicylatoxidans]